MRRGPGGLRATACRTGGPSGDGPGVAAGLPDRPRPRREARCQGARATRRRLAAGGPQRYAGAGDLRSKSNRLDFLQKLSDRTGVGGVHVAKYKGGAVGAMLGHYERKAETERGYRRPNIDPARTNQNYNLGPVREGRGSGYVAERIESLHLKRTPRKDAVRLCDCVVTAPRDLDPSRRAEFFAAAYGVLADRYGLDNVVSSWVHMDEARPHMHFAWVPVTEDGRLSAKDVVSRKDLRTLHPDLEREVSARMGVQVHLLLDDDVKGDKELSRLDQADYRAAKDRLAAETAKAEAAAALRALTDAANTRQTARATVRAAEADDAEDRRDKAKEGHRKYTRMVIEAYKERRAVMDEVDGLRGEASALDGEVEELRRQADYEEHRAADAEARRLAAETALKDARKRLESVQESKRKEDEKSRALGVREATAKEESARFAAERDALRAREGRAERDCQGLKQRIKEQVKQAFTLVREQGRRVVERCAEAVGLVRRAHDGRWALSDEASAGAKVVLFAFWSNENDLKSDEIAKAKTRKAGRPIVDWGAVTDINQALREANAEIARAGGVPSAEGSRVEREDDWDLGL